ncbi:MAG: hypothetical protein JO119_15540, partial [Acidobacteria bacterium]|nr:hypothetical protein [Acidobacteriota bacterium]
MTRAKVEFVSEAEELKAAPRRRTPHGLLPADRYCVRDYLVRAGLLVVIGWAAVGVAGTQA